MDLSSYEAFIFDFDGVIFDTEKYHFQAWQEACLTLGVNLSEEEYLPLRSTGRKTISGFIEKKLARKFNEGERESLIAKKADIFSKLVLGISEKDFIPGALEFLARLKSAGKKTAVGSSGSITKSIIERFKIGCLFGTVIDGSDNLTQKPAPDIFLRCASNLSVPPEKCIVFEDSLAGLTAACTAKMDCIAVGGINFPQALYNIKDFTNLL